MNKHSEPANPRKNVLYVEGNVDGTIGGSFFSLLFLIEGLDKTLFQPTVVFSFHHKLIPQFEAAGARVLIRPLAQPKRWRGSVGRLLAKVANFLLGFVIEPFRLMLLCRKLKVDLVHLNNSITRNHPWMAAARMSRIPCVTHERGINREYSTRSKALGRQLAAVICISDAVRRNFNERGIDDLRFVTIPNGLDPRKMKPTITAEQVHVEFGIGAEAQLIGIVGNLKQWKGQEVVIKAFQLLAERFPNLVCLMIGDFSADDDEYRARIMNLIEALDLRGRVIVTGYRSNVANYVNALQVLIHASIDPEPFGRVLLEGMALRKPLVASRGGAVPEIVEDGVTGMLFEPGNPSDLARCLSELLDEPSRAREMGEAGFHRLSAKFGIERNVRLTEQLYADILANGHRRTPRPEHRG